MVDGAGHEEAVARALGAALADEPGRACFARFAREHAALLGLAEAFVARRAAEAQQGQAQAQAPEAQAPEAEAPEAVAPPPPPVAPPAQPATAWGPEPAEPAAPEAEEPPAVASTPAAAGPGAEATPQAEPWQPENWDPASAFGAFQQQTPQGARRSGAKKGGRGARRPSAGDRAPPSAQQGPDSPPAAAPPEAAPQAAPAAPADSNPFAFNFGNLRIGEEPKAAAAAATDMETDAEKPPAPAGRAKPQQRTPRRPAHSAPARKSPASGQQDSVAFVPEVEGSPAAASAAFERPADEGAPATPLAAATVPQFNMGAPGSQSGRRRDRRKGSQARDRSRQREPKGSPPSAQGPNGGVDAPPVVFDADGSDGASKSPEAAGLPEDASNRARFDEVSKCPQRRRRPNRDTPCHAHGTGEQIKGGGQRRIQPIGLPRSVGAVQVRPCTVRALWASSRNVARPAPAAPLWIWLLVRSRGRMSRTRSCGAARRCA